jgi:8-oxo-dGTP diphosphatase
MKVDLAYYPSLSKRNIWENIDSNFEISDTIPPKISLISNVNIVPFIGDRCVIIQLQNGDWEIPGGNGRT